MNIDTKTFDNGIKKLCELIDNYKQKNNVYPVLVTNPKIIQGIEYYWQAAKSEVSHDVLQHVPIVDFYSRDANYRYINRMVPEGLVIFKGAHEAEIHRIYDYPRDEEEETKTQDAIGTVFRGLDFDRTI